MSLRTPETEEKYSEYRAANIQHECGMCADEPLKAFSFWKILKNEFPYDAIASIHHILTPLRHATEDELTDEERAEFKALKKEVLDGYDFIMENGTHSKTIPEHFHLHLVTTK